VTALAKLGVQALAFTGDKRVFDVPVLGKGYVGVVVVAVRDGRKVALKIRRLDANRSGMEHEADMLRKANAVDVGPRLIDTTANFLLMEFVDGALLPRWIEDVKAGEELRVRRVLRSLLEQCWRLDKIGVDHGELSRAPKHIIVRDDDRPCIVDFETASLNRRVSNVTSVCQYLFIGSDVAETIAHRLGGIDRDKLIKALRAYKQRRTRACIENVLVACGLRRIHNEPADEVRSL
jgi:putative serine/threonine protein kinase